MAFTDHMSGLLHRQGTLQSDRLLARTTCHEFIRSHRDVLTARDFFTVELLVGRRLVRCTLFSVMELVTRKVFFAPAKLQPDARSLMIRL
jgi:hypothetical protein